MSSSSTTWWYKARRNLKASARRRNLKFKLTLDECRSLMTSKCHYCEVPECRGIDRLNSKSGYTKKNCAPACLSCNFILTDLPPRAKMELKKGLSVIRKKNLLKRWLPAVVRASRAYNLTKKKKQHE